MDLLSILNKRISIREFKKRNVSESLIKEIIELANSSPSAGNIQARAVIVVKDKDAISAIKDTASGLRRFNDDIPVLIVVLAKPYESAERFANRGRDLYALQDATILASYIQLIAVSKGLATCWVGSFVEEKINEVLNISGKYRPIAIIPLGYPIKSQKTKQRKSLKEIILKKI